MIEPEVKTIFQIHSQNVKHLCLLRVGLSLHRFQKHRQNCIDSESDTSTCQSGIESTIHFGGIHNGCLHLPSFFSKLDKKGRAGGWSALRTRPVWKWTQTCHSTGNDRRWKSDISTLEPWDCIRIKKATWWNIYDSDPLSAKSRLYN